MKTILCAAAALLTLSVTNVQASTASLLAFGDSLVDSGNARLLTLAGGGTWNADVYPKGQFTNGNTWATQLGLAPSLTGGTNYAYGGARAVRNDDPIPDLMNQIRAFRRSGVEVDDKTTAAIWVGGNDFLALPDGASERRVTRVVSRVVRKISRGVARLNRLGVSNVVVLGLPDFGLLPENAGDPVAAGQASVLTQIYNGALQAAMTQLNAGSPTTDVRYFDVNGLFQEVLAQVPADLISVPCLADLAGCASNPRDYVLYDNIHPSAWVHTALANALSAEIGIEVTPVPLPATAPLLLAGLGGTVLILRRRRSRA
ncbi:MAG: SGNH/GDSL hydrolase family protein [Paracoccaceae bacterium]|nr:SGNH/GDSL hydrolase family protein [Paracoccaceae bacterium]